MAENGSELRALAWSSIFLGLVLAAAQIAWYSIGPKGLGGSDTVQLTYVAVVVLAVGGWLAIVGSGLAAVTRGVLPGGLASAGLAAGAIALLGAAVLLALAGSDRLGPDAFDDVLMQTWPTLVLCLFAGDWVRRARGHSSQEVSTGATRGTR